MSDTPVVIDDQLLSRAEAAYLGLALGDALGATVEFMTPREIAHHHAHRSGIHREIVGGLLIECHLFSSCFILYSSLACYIFNLNSFYFNQRSLFIRVKRFVKIYRKFTLLPSVSWSNSGICIVC